MILRLIIIGGQDIAILDRQIVPTSNARGRRTGLRQVH
jgi:hypothetical protein